MIGKVRQRSIRRGVAALAVVVTTLFMASYVVFTTTKLASDSPGTPGHGEGAESTPNSGADGAGSEGGGFPRSSRTDDEGDGSGPGEAPGEPSVGDGRIERTPPVGGGDGSEPQWAGYRKYKRRCHKLDLTGARGRVVYEPHMEMTRGDPDVVRAAVTFDQSTPPDEILRAHAAEEPGLVVSCHIRAQLSVSEYEFEVNEQGWVERSLLTSATARWHWYVTPKLGGTHDLVLRVHPIMKTRSQDASSARTIRPRHSAAQDFDLVSAENANVQEYETRIHVNVPWSERPQEMMSRLAATFKIAEGLVTALTGLVIAVLALGAALGLRKWKRKRA
jgi:hypothetical protein